MKFTEIQIENIVLYLRLNFEDLTGNEKQELSVMLESARQFIRSYIGQNDEFLDTKDDIVIATYVCCQHMYDNRCFVIETNKLNPMIKMILEQYAVNHLI